MTKTQALREARIAVSLPFGRGTSWFIVGPWEATKPRGTTTESTASSYAHALKIRASWVAYIALVLLGWDRTEAQVEVARAVDAGWTRIEDLVAQANKSLLTTSDPR